VVASAIVLVGVYVAMATDEESSEEEAACSL
jgi:hypothetical protein